MVVENNFIWKCCPVCFSGDIVKKGDLFYKGETKFTTVEVNISSLPGLWMCSSCLSFFVQNIFSEDTATYLYSTGCSNERWSGGDFDAKMAPATLKVLMPMFEHYKRVLDIGCNSGELLDCSKKFDCETSGVELSESSRNILDKKGHCAFQKISDVKGCFDLIVAFDLIEHLYSVTEFFNACFRLLSENGKLVILTGNPYSLSARLANYKWWYLQYPEHIVFPSQFYYKQIPGVKYFKSYGTYASVGYVNPFKHRIKNAFKKIVKSNYNGLPAIGPDHHLIVLGN